MIFKPKIKSILKHIPLLLLALVCTLTINTIQAQAFDQGAIVAAVKANITGVSNSGHTTTTIPKGVTADYTGFLCYMYKEEGGVVPGTHAVLLKGPNFAYYDGNVKIKVTSKNGEFTKTNFDGTAPWPYSPFNRDTSSNQSQIKDWMLEIRSDGIQNAVSFIIDNWGKEVALKFGSGEYVLVVETILHFQYSSKGDNLTSTPPTTTAEDVIAMLKKQNLKEYQILEREGGAKFLVDTLVERINAELAAEWEGVAVSSGYQLLGDPIVGTCSDCLDYYAQVIAQHTSTNLFSRYTRNIACFAEMIQEDEAGFTEYTGSTASTIRLSDGEIKNNGVALFILSAENDAINTYSPSEGSPGPAENPADNPSKQGTKTIVKGYYTENETTGEKVSEGVFTQPNTTNRINIMDEPEYQLVKWDITTGAPTTPDPAGSWISGSPSGTAPTTVELTTEEKNLYVLLKKVESEIPETEGTWILNESEITKIFVYLAPYIIYHRYLSV